MGGCALCANKSKVEKNIQMELSQIELKDGKVDSLVNVIIKKNGKYLENSCFILVGVRDDNNSTEVIITLYEKSKFELPCTKNDYHIVGYAEFDHQVVLFIGGDFGKMEETKNKKVFIFTCREEGKNHPPSMYNPTIHKFVIRNDGQIEYTSEK